MQRPIWKPGPHNVYIAYDKTKSWFKIGMTGDDLERYRKAICYRAYGRRSHDKIEIQHSWLFQDFWAAWYIEQTAIAFVKRFGFESVREGDWFAIDEPTMDVVWNLIDDLAYDIRQWEKVNLGLQCEPPPHWPPSPWGAALKKMRKAERYRRANAEHLNPHLRPDNLRRADST